MKKYLRNISIAVAASGLTIYFLHKLYLKKISTIKKQFIDKYQPSKSIN